MNRFVKINLFMSRPKSDVLLYVTAVSLDEEFQLTAVSIHNIKNERITVLYKGQHVSFAKLMEGLMSSLANRNEDHERYLLSFNSNSIKENFLNLRHNRTDNINYNLFDFEFTLVNRVHDAMISHVESDKNRKEIPPVINFSFIHRRERRMTTIYDQWDFRREIIKITEEGKPVTIPQVDVHDRQYDYKTEVNGKTFIISGVNEFVDKLHSEFDIQHTGKPPLEFKIVVSRRSTLK